MKKYFFTLLFLFLALLTFKNVSAQTIATDSSDSIKDKVEEKINQARQRAKAYIGVITDKTEESLQLKKDTGEIILVSIDADNTDFIKVDKQTSTAKYSDVAIGDYIISMGYVDEENVLSATRVLITQEIKKPSRNVYFGKIVSIENKKVSVNFDGQEYQLSFPKKWDGPEINELNSGDEIAVVGSLEENNVLLRTIYVFGNL